MFEIEQLPETATLYIRVHKNLINANKITRRAFQDLGEGAKRGLSSDWDKYSTPLKTCQRNNKNPDNYGVVAFRPRHLLDYGLISKHDPIEENLEKSIEENQSHVNSRNNSNEDMDLEIREALAAMANSGEYFAKPMPTEAGFLPTVKINS